jgi:hypothetical protein
MACEALLIAQAWEQNDTGTSQSPPPSLTNLSSEKLRCDAIITAYYVTNQNLGASAHAQPCTQLDPHSGHSVMLSAGSPPPPCTVPTSPRASPQKSRWYVGGRLEYSTGGPYILFILFIILPDSYDTSGLMYRHLCQGFCTTRTNLAVQRRRCSSSMWTTCRIRKNWRHKAWWITPQSLVDHTTHLVVMHP